MRSLKVWTCSSLLNPKLNSNLARRLKLSNLTVVVYYGRYDGSGEQHPRPFSIFLKECGIVLEYTMLGKPSMNGVGERRNRTLQDMVRSMISHSSLLESLWGEELKTAMYILNRVPS